jgi:ubiquinol oxidase
MSKTQQPVGYKNAFISSLLFGTMDLFYGGATTLSKLKVLELIARVPYQSWEHNFFVWLTHHYGQTSYVERALQEVKIARAAQDNEQWHLFILADLINQLKIKENFLLHVALPQVIAFTYFYIISVIHFIRPEWSYKLNADFEHHAEHTYLKFVADNHQLENQIVDSAFLKYYGTQHKNLAELLLQFAEDERHHKEESLEMIKRAKEERALLKQQKTALKAEAQQQIVTEKPESREPGAVFEDTNVVQNNALS